MPTAAVGGAADGMRLIACFDRYEEQRNDGVTSSNQPREYEDIVKMLFEKDRTTVEVDFKHVSNYDEDLADRIKAEYYRFERVLKASLNQFAKQVVTRVLEDKDDTVTPEKIPDFNLAFYNLAEQVKLSPAPLALSHSHLALYNLANLAEQVMRADLSSPCCVN
jgi:DNA replicative helicase MCM subunit Mcm2 (Cdc46/Mcm family)